MPVMVRCPDCSTRLNVPDSAAGKTIKCPRCGGRVTVPAPTLEVTDKAEPEGPVIARPKPRPANKEAGAEDAPPPGPPRRARRRDEREEEEDERPRPRRGNAEAGGTRARVLLFAGVGGLVLLLAAGGGVWWLTRTKPPTAGNGPGPSPPTKDNPKGNGRGGDVRPPTKPEATAKVLSPLTRIRVTFGEVTAVRLNRDGTRAVVANSPLSGRAAFQVWDLKPVPKKTRELPGSVQAVSRGLERVVRKADSSTYEVVDLATGSVVAKLPLTGFEYHFRSPGAVVVLKRGNKEEDGDKAGRLIVREYDVAARRAADLFDVAADPSTRTALARDGGELFVGRPKTGRVDVWDLAGRKQARAFTLAGLPPKDSWAQFTASPDGKWVLVETGETGEPKIFDGSTGAAVATSGSAQLFPTFVPGRNMVMGRNTVVVNSLTGEVRNGVWAYDIDRRTITACLPGTGSGLAFSADGRTAAGWELFKQTDILIWDLTQLP